ncbi:MAG: flavodoxin [Eubacteriales bacterium]|nr:flavodoxin [Eubacteriales bacterium]
MKRQILTIAVALLMSMALAGCGSQASTESTQTVPENSEAVQVSESTESVEGTDKEDTEVTDAASTAADTEQAEQIEPVSGSDTLVVYFSCTGTTKGVAETIANVSGGDLFEIVPVQVYTTDDLNYNDSSSRSTKEQNDSSVRPEISNEIENWDSYSTVYLGYPIWWGEEPRIMDTFAESYDFSGKTVIPFCTSGGSGVGRSDSNMEGLAGTGNWLGGTRLKGGASEGDISDWIAGLNIE